MLGVKDGHTIFCDEDCSFTHHEVLVKLLLCKRNDMKTFETFKLCVQNMVAQGWDVNGEIPDNLMHFRFPLVHWAAVYGKLAVLKWLTEEKFDLAVTNTDGENALHRLVACQAHERAMDRRTSKLPGSRRYSLQNITQVFTKVMNILTDTSPQMLLWYDFVERHTPLQLCLKLLNESDSLRVTLYHETVFKLLCERLVELVKKQRLTEEYVRNALAHKDTAGNTLWHSAAVSKSQKVVIAVNYVINRIKNIDLFSTNNNGDTPSMVALKKSFTQFASMVEEYKTPTLVIPMVKMEAFMESPQCHCEPKGNTENQQDGCVPVAAHEVLDRSTSLQIESSPAVSNSQFLVTDEQSFPEVPKCFTAIDQPKVVLTNIETDIQQPMCSGRVTPGKTSECNSEVVGDVTKNLNITVQSDLSCQDVVIEKQIDLVVDVTQSPEISPSSVKQGVTTVPGSETSLTAENQEEVQQDSITCEQPSSLKDSVYKNTSHSPNEKSSGLSPSKTLSDRDFLHCLPVFENKTSCHQTGGIPELLTPVSIEGNVCKSVNVTPVLLIKLLSEPDVSEKFQSLLKDVITGDAEKVDSAQSTLEKLSISKVKVDNKIAKSEESLKDIDTKKALVKEAISKLQLKLDLLQTSEYNARSELEQLKKEQDNICQEMKECESTCNRLKRRLSDCTGALNGLSPKQQKRC